MTFEGVIAVVFTIGAILLFHESGHFLVAKACRMRIDEFGIGLPLKSPIVALKRGETTYSLNWIPFGAFVRIAGMDPEEGNVERGFHTRPLWQRGVVLAAGSSMNVVLAALLFLCAGVFFGEATDVSTTIHRTLPGSPAAQAGLRSGDQIVAINDCWTSTEVARVKDGTPGAAAGLRAGDQITQVAERDVRDFRDMVSRLGTESDTDIPITVKRWDEAEQLPSTHRLRLPRLADAAAILAAAPRSPTPAPIDQLGVTFKPLQWGTVTSIIHNSPRVEMAVTVVREGAQITKKIIPEPQLREYLNTDTGEVEQRSVSLIGVVPEHIYRHLSPLESIRSGFATTAATAAGVLEGVARLILGEEKPQVVSIVKIAVNIQEYAYEGGYSVLRFGGIISFVIGFLNILPLPPFDGWRLVYLGYEGVIGRTPDRKKEALINLVGFAVVMFAFVILVLKDVMDLVANRAVR
ncbi:MAG: site-2 protease family protein [Armatimonadota bacterium]